MRTIGPSPPPRAVSASSVSFTLSFVCSGSTGVSRVMLCLSADHPPRELGGVHLAVVLELEEEAVAALARELRLERDGAAASGLTMAAAVLAAALCRVRMEVGEIALAERHKVTLRPEVVLERHLLPAARYVERQRGGTPGTRGPGQIHPVAVRSRGSRRPRRRR